MKVRNSFDRHREAISFDPAEKRTKDSFKDECDINEIMKRYKRNGQLPALVAREPRFGDFSNAMEYQDALNVVLTAQRQFDALPAAVRAECFNNPEVFLEKVQDPEFAKKHKLALPPSPASSGVPGGSQGAPAPKEKAPPKEPAKPKGGAKPSDESGEA